MELLVLLMVDGWRLGDEMDGTISAAASRLDGVWAEILSRQQPGRRVCSFRGGRVVWSLASSSVQDATVEEL